MKDTIASTIKTAITAFRNYKTAERQLVIAEMGLVRANALYEYNREMITAGRLAGTEIVQAQADIATQETSVINAKNSLDAARMALVQALYIDKNTSFQAADENSQLISPPAMEEAVSLAFQHRTDYLRALQDLEVRKLDLAKNKINRLWSLNLTAGTTDGTAGTTFNTYDPAFRRAIGSGAERNCNVGLSLEVPLVYMTSDMRAYLGAKTEMEKASLAFEKLKLDLEISVQNAVRNVDSNYRSLLSAKLARELEGQTRVFVDYYNHHRYHEALKNVTPADMYYGRDLEILERREQIKQETILLRRKQNHTLRLVEKAGKVYMRPETLS